MTEGPPVTPASGYGMISVDEAQRIVLDACAPLAITTLPTPAAVGYIAAIDVHAKDPLPPFPASIKVYPLTISPRRGPVVNRTGML